MPYASFSETPLLCSKFSLPQTYPIRGVLQTGEYLLGASQSITSLSSILAFMSGDPWHKDIEETLINE